MRGFSLAEALVAIVVVSFGVLGTAGLQLASMRNSNEAGAMAQAVRLSTTYAERIRAGIGNDTVVQAYLTASDTIRSTTPISVPACTSATPCSSTDVAIRDTHDWKIALANELPGGEGVLCRESADPARAIKLAAKCAPPAPTPAGTPEPPLVLKVWWRGRTAKGEVVDPAAAPFRPQISIVVTP